MKRKLCAILSFLFTASFFSSLMMGHAQVKIGSTPVAVVITSSWILLGPRRKWPNIYPANSVAAILAADSSYINHKKISSWVSNRKGNGVEGYCNSSASLYFSFFTFTIKVVHIPFVKRRQHESPSNVNLHNKSANMMLGKENCQYDKKLKQTAH